MNSRIWLHILFALATVLSTPLFADTLKIGALLPLTGEFAMEAEEFRRGIHLATKEINDTGGPNKTTLVAVIEDSQYSAKQSTSAAKKLLEIDQVSGVITATYTEVMSTAALFEKRKIPVIHLWDSSEELEALGDHVFAIGPWAPSSGEKAAELARSKLKANSAVVINTNNEWSQDVSKHFEKKFKQDGGDVLATFSVNPGESDFRALLLKALKQEPDTLYAPITNDVIPFFKQLRSVGFKKSVITSDVLTQEYIDAADGALEGVYQLQGTQPSSPETEKLKQLYNREFGVETKHILYNAWGYDAVHLIADALRVAEGNPEKAAKQLYRVRKHPGASGLIAFTPEGSSPRFASVFQVRNSRLHLDE